MTEVENGCANGTSTPENKDSDSSGLDSILLRIGQFGKFQIRSYGLIIPPMIFNAYLMCVYIFLTGSVVHRCRVPECDGPNSTYDEPWTEFSIPTMKSSGDLDKCNRFVPYNRSSDMCFADNYDQNSKEGCGIDFIFRDKELYISNDFDIYCLDEWKLSLVGTVSVAGQLVGSPLGGLFSDRFGRRSMVAIGGFTSAVFGIIRSFSPSYYMFLILGFLENVGSGIIYATLFIIGVELVSHRARVLSCSILPMFFSVGEILLAIIAKSVPNWRWILRIGYTPALAHIALIWLLPESVRWLLSRGDEKKAAEVLRNAAKMNKRKVSEATIEKLILENRYKLEKENLTTQFPITKAFKTFPWRIINCSICWFSNVLVYHGLNLNSVLLGGNKYDSFMYLALVEIPAYGLLSLTLNRIGRRFSLFGCLLICGICLGTTIFISKEFYVLQLSLFLVGKMAITISFQCLYFYTSEIFPTNCRNGLLSLCSMFGRIGSMVAPQTVLLAKFNESAPAILFSICALVAGFLALLFPETTDVILPSTVDEAGEIGHKMLDVKDKQGAS
ncbi:organic cation transporter protein-like [Eupeodes corollae]|uniref:organic cation transporter protein-like n=1 Tax=Eupeodes corollae TaxID=290404 RepID=UPI002490339F|nr:organic cation transporter protein-like [Eupeodes corollae]